MRKRELVAVLVLMSYYCKCFVALPHGAVGGLLCVIVVFPGHTHLLFVIVIRIHEIPK